MSGLEKIFRESPRLWKVGTLDKLPKCSVRGEVIDMSGTLLCTLQPIKPLSEGVFGIIDLFYRKQGEEKKQVILKRPKERGINLLLEGLFQSHISEEFTKFGIGHVVPKVYDIFVHKPSGDVMFTMEYIEGSLLSYWCIEHIPKKGGIRLFVLLLLQLALILEVLEKEFYSEHRDLKSNNILIEDIPCSFPITWKQKDRTLYFPFRIVLIDFGFACQKEIDIRSGDGLPPLEPCPKEGRDIFQILVSLWSIPCLRECLNTVWGKWIVERVSFTNSRSPITTLCETCKDLSWLYPITDDRNFRAPLCAPRRIIEDCMMALEDSL